MKTKFIFYILICMLHMLPCAVHAQTDGEKVVEFSTSNAVLEDDPKNQTWNITIYSPDGEWKMQLHYKAESMFGTFGNDDFDLSGTGKNYNYARNPKNDMVFYSFTDMNVTVSDEGTLYRVKANCLANNKTRFLVDATIDAPRPEATREDNLGYARVEQNPFYGTWAIYSENENYKLAYGVVGDQLLGTFYRADLLMPELYDKKANKNVNILTATALHTQEGDNTNLKIDILGDDHVLYSLSMFNGPYDMPITSEKDIEIWDAVLQDLTDMYGCFQFGGVNDEYGMAIAVKPEAMAEGRRTWTRNDLIMQYTQLVTLPEATPIDIFDLHIDVEEADKDLMLKAHVTAMDGTLYHVNMHMASSDVMPEAKDTVNISFGHVSMLDYTQEVGTVGFGAVVQGHYQMRFYLNTYELEGDFTTSDFVMDMCDMMVVTDDTYLFHDGKYMNVKMEKEESGRIRITADMLCVDDVLYHATMYIDPMKCLEGGDYSIDQADNVDMVSIQAINDGYYAEYLMQFQCLDQDENGMVKGDGYYFSFYFPHEGTGVNGEYGYSAGTLAGDVYHAFFENKCEVRMAPVAGTFKLESTEPLLLNLPQLGIVKTYIYKADFQLLGQNGAIYRGTGQNVLICIDEDGKIVPITEETTGILQQELEKQGLNVRKVMKDGKVLIQGPAQQFDLQGRRIKAAPTPDAIHY